MSNFVIFCLYPGAFCDDDEIRANVWFLIDGSPPVEDQDFQTQLNFSRSLASKLYINPEKVQFGMSVFAHEHSTYQAFEDTATLEDFINAVQPATRPPIAGAVFEV